MIGRSRWKNGTHFQLWKNCDWWLRNGHLFISLFWKDSYCQSDLFDRRYTVRLIALNLSNDALGSSYWKRDDGGPRGWLILLYPGYCYFFFASALFNCIRSATLNKLHSLENYLFQMKIAMREFREYPPVLLIAREIMVRENKRFPRDL